MSAGTEAILAVGSMVPVPPEQPRSQSARDGVLQTLLRSRRNSTFTDTTCTHELRLWLASTGNVRLKGLCQIGLQAEKPAYATYGPVRPKLAGVVSPCPHPPLTRQDGQDMEPSPRALAYAAHFER